MESLGLLHIGVICGIIGTLFGLVSLIVAVLALSKVIGMEKSTHQVTYMPIDPEVDKENQAFMDKWATDEDTLKEQQKLYGEDLEDLMPEFKPSDTDKKKYSF